MLQAELVAKRVVTHEPVIINRAAVLIMDVIVRASVRGLGPRLDLVTTEAYVE